MGTRDIETSKTDVLMLKGLLVSLRPKQWYKNLLLFVGLVFSHNLLNSSMWVTALLAFVYFCMASSAGYMFNDVNDKKIDEVSSLKRNKPIASGHLNIYLAWGIAVILWTFALVGAYVTISPPFYLALLGYVILSVLYTWKLKHIVLVDVIVISMGFVIRAVAGCVAINVVVSSWLIICAFLLALFLALGKRRHELVIIGDNSRASLHGYSPQVLEQLTGIATGALIVSYSLYTFYADNYYLMLTIPFAIYGLFRYLFLVHSKTFGGEPEMIFRDRAMVVNFALWVAVLVGTYYME